MTAQAAVLNPLERKPRAGISEFGGAAAGNVEMPCCGLTAAPADDTGSCIPCRTGTAADERQPDSVRTRR